MTRFYACSASKRKSAWVQAARAPLALVPEARLPGSCLVASLTDAQLRGTEAAWSAGVLEAERCEAKPLASPQSYSSTLQSKTTEKGRGSMAWEVATTTPSALKGAPSPHRTAAVVLGVAASGPMRRGRREDAEAGSKGQVAVSPRDLVPPSFQAARVARVVVELALDWGGAVYP